jgi:hypothetical protein
VRGTRTLANIIHRSLGGKTDIYDLWKLHTDYKDPGGEKVVITAEEYAKIQERSARLFSTLKKRKR